MSTDSSDRQELFSMIRHVPSISNVLADLMHDSMAVLCYMQSGKSANDPACKSDRAAARAFPTQVAQGLLWVWPESGPHAWLESSMQPPKLIPEMTDPSWTGAHSSALHTTLTCALDVLVLPIFMLTAPTGMHMFDLLAGRATCCL